MRQIHLSCFGSRTVSIGIVTVFIVFAVGERACLAGGRVRAGSKMARFMGTAGQAPLEFLTPLWNQPIDPATNVLLQEGSLSDTWVTVWLLDIEGAVPDDYTDVGAFIDDRWIRSARFFPNSDALYEDPVLSATIPPIELVSFIVAGQFDPDSTTGIPSANAFWAVVRVTETREIGSTVPQSIEFAPVILQDAFPLEEQDPAAYAALIAHDLAVPPPGGGAGSGNCEGAQDVGSTGPTPFVTRGDCFNQIASAGGGEGFITTDPAVARFSGLTTTNASDAAVDCAKKATDCINDARARLLNGKIGCWATFAGLEIGLGGTCLAVLVTVGPVGFICLLLVDAANQAWVSSCLNEEVFKYRDNRQPCLDRLKTCCENAGDCPTE